MCAKFTEKWGRDFKLLPLPHSFRVELRRGLPGRKARPGSLTRCRTSNSTCARMPYRQHRIFCLHYVLSCITCQYLHCIFNISRVCLSTLSNLIIFCSHELTLQHQIWIDSKLTDLYLRWISKTDLYFTNYE